MNVVDSCGWIEYLTDGTLADKYWKYIKNPAKIATPTIVLYEVYKIIKRERAEEDALVAVSFINKTEVVLLTESIALLAADMSLKYAIPMADAIVYATAIEQDCTVITHDDHFRRLDRVVFIS